MFSNSIPVKGSLFFLVVGLTGFFLLKERLIEIESLPYKCAYVLRVSEMIQWRYNILINHGCEKKKKKLTVKKKIISESKVFPSVFYPE